MKWFSNVVLIKIKSGAGEGGEMPFIHHYGRIPRNLSKTCIVMWRQTEKIQKD